MFRSGRTPTPLPQAKLATAVEISPASQSIRLLLVLRKIYTFAALQSWQKQANNCSAE
ncbi:MAG: hypothetical protein ACOX1Y_04990 [Zhaonellaceae bacterium]|nr:hypothetical protein [Clostridia bacterium]